MKSWHYYRISQRHALPASVSFRVAELKRRTGQYITQDVGFSINSKYVPFHNGVDEPTMEAEAHRRGK
jgi:hypothetical protein